MRQKLSGATTNLDVPGAKIRPGDAYSFDRAWSINRIRSAWTGACMEVVRRSDQAVRDIGFTADDKLDWATLLAWAGSSSVEVSKLYDQSGNGVHLVQTTSAARPRIVAAGVAEPGLYFDGTDDHLRADTAGLYAAGAATVLGVVSGSVWANGQGIATGHIFAESNAAAANGRYIPLSRGAGSSGNETRAAAYVITDAGATVAQATRAGIFDGQANKHQVTMIDTGALLTFRGDGSGEPGSAYTRAALTTTVTAMGARIHSSGAQNFYRGYIYEVLTRAIAFPLADVTKLEANARTRLIA